MRLRVNLRGATSADVTIIVADEGISIPVTFVLRPVASGVLKTVMPATAPFPRLVNARPSWVPAPDGAWVVRTQTPAFSRAVQALQALEE